MSPPDNKVFLIKMAISGDRQYERELIHCMLAGVRGGPGGSGEPGGCPTLSFNHYLPPPDQLNAVEWRLHHWGVPFDCMEVVAEVKGVEALFGHVGHVGRAGRYVEYWQFATISGLPVQLWAIVSTRYRHLRFDMSFMADDCRVYGMMSIQAGRITDQRLNTDGSFMSMSHPDFLSFAQAMCE